MASRRTRIKGIANIPQRKKPSVEIAADSVKIKTEVNIHAKKEIGDVCQKQITDNNESNSLEINDTSTFPQNELKHSNESTTKVSEDSTKTSLKAETSSIEFTKSSEFVPVASQPQTEKIPTEIAKPVPPSRRKVLKPGININLIKQRNAIKEPTITLHDNDNGSSIPLSSNSNHALDTTIECKPENIQEDHTQVCAKIEDVAPNKGSNKVIVLSEIRIANPKVEKKVACDITKIISEPSTTYTEMTLNEAHFNINEVPQVDSSSIVTFSPVKSFVHDSQVSDSEYPAPPPSPSKINRARIKAIPKLGLRKASCSASESEDESRKYGRIRNNSVCSIASTTYQEPQTPTSEGGPRRDQISVPTKKINRTEQSRKLAEARREFYKRFGTNMPDKQHLKMIDLIFYNPTTNPMSQKTITDSKPPSEEEEKEVEEQVDDPTKEDVKDKENDVDSMPVPQIKIGPSGEIILDEQSLIVENTEITKQNEILKKSKVVNADSDTGYGIYKRAPRAQKWSQKETLRFYKALNLIGTDFTVMTQLFPKRNRRELKMKFKKEENINRHLVDRAITQPCRYNFLDLKREMEIEQEEEAFLQKLRDEELQKIKEDKEMRRDNKRKKTEVTGDKLVEKEGIEDLPFKKRFIDKSPKPQKSKPSIELNITFDDIDDDMDGDNETDEEEIIPYLKPTRSGRMPKSTLKFVEPDEPPKKRIYSRPNLVETDKKTYAQPHDPSSSRLPINAFRNRRFSSTSSVESNSDKLIPGSVVVTSEEGPDGQHEYKVFMVTPEKKLTPLQLDSDIVARLVKDGNGAEFPIVSTPENNITIPAVEKDSSIEVDGVS